MSVTKPAPSGNNIKQVTFKNHVPFLLKQYRNRNKVQW